MPNTHRLTVAETERLQRGLETCYALLFCLNKFLLQHF